MSRLAIFDTSVLVTELRTGRYTLRIDSLDSLIRNSSVVLSELLRGARNRADKELVRSLATNHPVLSPTTNNWIESGEILLTIAADTGFTPDKLRDLHFDVLIALTARSWGARLITSNKADFELIKSYRHFELEVW